MMQSLTQHNFASMTDFDYRAAKEVYQFIDWVPIEQTYYHHFVKWELLIAYQDRIQLTNIISIIKFEYFIQYKDLMRYRHCVKLLSLEFQIFNFLKQKMSQIQFSPPKCSISLFCCHFDYNVIQPTQGLKRNASTNYFHGQKNKLRFNRERRSLKHRLNTDISGIENNFNNYSNQSSEFRLKVSEYSSELNLVTPVRNSFIHPLDRTVLEPKNSLKKISFNAQNLQKQNKKQIDENKNSLKGKQIATIHQAVFPQNYKMRSSALKKSSHLGISSMNKRSTENMRNSEQEKKVIFDEKMSTLISNPE